MGPRSESDIMEYLYGLGGEMERVVEWKMDERVRRDSITLQQGIATNAISTTN